MKRSKKLDEVVNNWKQTLVPDECISENAISIFLRDRDFAMRDFEYIELNRYDSSKTLASYFL